MTTSKSFDWLKADADAKHSLIIGFGLSDFSHVNNMADILDVASASPSPPLLRGCLDSDRKPGLKYPLFLLRFHSDLSAILKSRVLAGVGFMKCE